MSIFWLNLIQNISQDLWEFSELEYELGIIVGRRVDLRTPKDLSPHFRNEVIAEAYHIYGKKRFYAS